MEKNNLFTGIAGYNAVKDEMESVISVINDKEKYVAKGARFPSGIIIYGEPGMGKTQFIEAVIANSNATAIRISESEAIEKDTTVEELIINSFKEACDCENGIVFIDELDKLIGYNARFYNSPENLKLQKIFLHEFDKVIKKGNCIVFAIANKLQLLDSSILRTGRFEKKIYIDRPGKSDRIEILNHYLKSVSLQDGVSVEELACITENSSCSDIESMVNEAIIISVKNDREFVSMQDFSTAYQKIVFSDIAKEKEPDEKKALSIAYHEAGHAVVGYLCDPDCILSASILPQGFSQGAVIISHKNEYENMELGGCQDKIKVALAGKVATEVMLGKQIMGSKSDISKACKIIDALMDEAVYGYEYVEFSSGEDFLPNIEAEDNPNRSGKRIEILYKYDAEVREMIMQNKALIQAVVSELMQKQKLNNSEIRKVIAKHNVVHV